MFQSEFARLREQIEREHDACIWALAGLSSGNAQHAFISARFRRMDACYAQLSLLAGEDVATDVLCKVFDRKQENILGKQKEQTDQNETVEPLVSYDYDALSLRDPSAR